MPVITISRGSYKLGKEVAEKLAQRLGYECVAREALLRESEKFNTFEIKLRRALQATTSSVFDRYSNEKNEYAAFMQEAILEHLVKDRVIYHGLAGHAFAQGVDHLISVRIQAHAEERRREEMIREGVSESEAQEVLKKAEEERRVWSLYVTGLDHWDPTYYDVIYNVSKIGVDNAVDLLSQIAMYPGLQATDRSQQKIEDMYLAARVKNVLIRDYPQAKVSSSGGRVSVEVPGPKHQQGQVLEKVRNKTSSLGGIDSIDVSFRT